jgi:hypothetical protein
VQASMEKELVYRKVVVRNPVPKSSLSGCCGIGRRLDKSNVELSVLYAKDSNGI